MLCINIHPSPLLHRRGVALKFNVNEKLISASKGDGDGAGLFDDCDGAAGGDTTGADGSNGDDVSGSAGAAGVGAGSGSGDLFDGGI